MTLFSRLRGAAKRLHRDDRGAVTIIMTVYLPFIVGICTFAVDMSYVYWTRNQLQVIAEAAALAATAQLPDNGPCGTASTACTVAQDYANRNRDANNNVHGTILANADVVVGRWTDGCLGGGISNSTCFVPAGSGGTSTDCTVSPQCNSVQVTTRQTSSNGNALQLTLASALGFGTFDVTATAIAVVGNDQNAPGFNAMIVQDISGSFTNQLPLGKAAVQALLDCLNKNAPTGSSLGAAVFTGTSPNTPYISPTSVTDSSSYNFLKNQIGDPNNTQSGIRICSGYASPYPQCNTNTSQASGMQVAYNTFCPYTPCPVAGNAGSKNAMIIVSDGLPVSSSANMCGSSQCTVAQLKQKAVDQANAAATQQIDIYTIYYGTDTAGRDWLKTLIRGNGIALDTPDASKLASLMGKVCVTALKHRLVW